MLEFEFLLSDGQENVHSVFGSFILFILAGPRPDGRGLNGLRRRKEKLEQLEQHRMGRSSEIKIHPSSLVQMPYIKGKMLFSSASDATVRYPYVAAKIWTGSVAVKP